MKIFSRPFLLIYLIFFQALSFSVSAQSDETLSFQENGFTLMWELQTDHASVAVAGDDGSVIWEGPLFPAFYIQTGGNTRTYLEPRFVSAEQEGKRGTIHLQYGTWGKGYLSYKKQAFGLYFTELKMEWAGAVPHIVSMLWGTDRLSSDEKQVVPKLDQPYWPSWHSHGFCVPSAKGAPIQSFFRGWDLGYATVPLGSFGTSMGTPYAAAFPRPVYSAAMGSDNGWVVLGAGSVPTGAMSLKIRTGKGSIEYLYRDDLWNNPEEQVRVWEDPLRIFWDDLAWDAYHRYFSSFKVPEIRPSHQKAVWNTWGDWKSRDFEIRKTIDFGLENGAEVIAFDDFWAESYGSSSHSGERFPDFKDHIRYVKEKGKEIGVWQTVGWIEYPEKWGLKEKDLLQGPDGEPRKASWLFTSGQYYCLDPSSEKTRNYLRERTEKLIRKYDISLLKLDFAYGMPPPNVAAPKNPKYRGEKLGHELFTIIAEKVREVDSSITVQYYSIHPLWYKGETVLSLDDLGDSWRWENRGHDQWSIWAAQAGALGMPVNASSGYQWEALPEILLNAAVLGAPGSVLPRNIDGNKVPEYYISKFRALSNWYRETAGWKPLWLNSHPGNMSTAPQLLSWGRLESDGKKLTALALNNPQMNYTDTLIQHGNNQVDSPGQNIPGIEKKPVKREEAFREGLAPYHMERVQSKGRWALISQTNQSLHNSKEIAVIPFDKRSKLFLPLAQKPDTVELVYRDHSRSVTSFTYRHNGLLVESPEDRFDDFLGFQIKME